MPIAIAPMPRTGPSPLGVRLGYSAGNFGKSVVWTSFESFMLFYLVSVAGLSPLAAGGLLAAVMAWDAAFDLAVACRADRPGAADRLRGLILIGAPLCATGFWLVFALDAPVAVGSAILLCRIGYSLCDVGHNALLVRVARTARDAASVSGLRLMFSAGGAGLVAIGSGRMLSIADRAGQQASFATGAMAGGLIYVAALFGAVFATRRLPPRRATGATGRSGQRLRALWRHAAFRRTLLLIAVQAGMVPLFNRALPFFGQAVHGDASWAGPALATITMAQWLSLPGWMALARRQPPVRIAGIAHGLMIVAMAGLAVASGGVAGTAMLALLGGALGGMNLAIWALLTLTAQAAIADGSSDEATPVGLFLAVLKGAAAIGNLGFAAIVAIGARVPDGGGTGDAALLPVSVMVVPVAGCIVALCLIAGWPDGGAARRRRAETGP